MVGRVKVVVKQGFTIVRLKETSTLGTSGQFYKTALSVTGWVPTSEIRFDWIEIVPGLDAKVTLAYE